MKRECMMRRLNRNSVPFGILFIIHSGMLCYSFYKYKNRKNLFILLLANIGLAYLFEYIVLNLMHSYKYKPKLLKNKKLDNVFGGILSQAIFVPFTAIFVTGNQLGWKVKLFFSFYFAFIENLFLTLKVYRHNWWRTLYSFLLFPFYFRLSDFWYKQLKKGQPVIQFVTLYLSTFVIGINMLFVLSVVRKFRFGWGRHHSWEEHFILAPLYSFFLSFVSTMFFSKKNNWRSWLSMLGFSIIFDIFLQKMKVIKSKLNSPFFNNFLHVFMIFIAALFRKWIYGQKETRN